MPVRFLSDAQREQLSGFPAELEPESLDRFFTLSGPDLAEVRRRHGDENRLGWSLQLCGLRMLGFCPDDVTTAPSSAVRFVARQLGVDPGVLDGYGSRAQTRTDHVNQVKAHLGFCPATNADLQDARDWLAAGAPPGRAVPQLSSVSLGRASARWPRRQIPVEIRGGLHELCALARMMRLRADP
jgi:hypothetical protein